MLTDLAYLDTCVTVVACNEFLEHFDHVGMNERGNPISQLLMEQIEFANVIISNKVDLVTEKDAEEVRNRISLINPRAELIEASQSQIDLEKILDTHRFNAQEMKIPPVQIEEEMVSNMKSCCLEKDAAGLDRCCDTKTSRTVKSKLSEILMPPKVETTKHKERFGISSFIYRARRPFHPERFSELFLEEYFIFFTKDEDEHEHEHDHDHDDAEDPKQLKAKFEVLHEKYEKLKNKYERMELNGGVADDGDDDVDESFALDDEMMSEGQDDEETGADGANEENDKVMKAKAAEKQSERYDKFNQLLRSKGFLWLANSHDIVQMMSQAGNMITIEQSNTWNVLSADSWVEGEAQTRNKKTWSEDGIYGDRRQELVFIGIDLDALNVQEVLDECLLTDEEFNLGPDGWKATMGDMFLF